jgi:predicted dehydrogenase
LIGGGFMAKAHSIAYAGMPRFFWPAPGIPSRRSLQICGGKRKGSRGRFGFSPSTSDWHKVIEDKDVDIVDICTPNNMHKEMASRAARQESIFSVKNRSREMRKSKGDAGRS